MENSSNFIKFEGSFYDLLGKSESYTFLAGAGISMNPPSNLPSARMLVTSLLKYMCPKDVLTEPSLNIKYELLIEVFRNEIDPNLKLIDYFSFPNQPNSIHGFLAYMMLGNNYVLTTNFDQLIEYAMMQINKLTETSKSAVTNCSVAITERDYNNLQEIKSKILYKLHGSNKNVFTGENTKESIVSTMDAIGKGMKNQEQMFVLPLYIHNTLEKLCSSRNLVFLGYGGGDGLDILPELARNSKINKILWIEHSDIAGISIEKYKISLESSSLETLPKISKLSNPEEFFKYISIHHRIPVYRIKGNTNEIVNVLREIFKVPHLPRVVQTEESKTPQFQTWLETCYSAIEEVKRCYLAGKLFRVSFDYDTSYKYLEWGRKLYLEKHQNPKDAPEEEVRTYAEILANLGMLYLTVQNYSMADLNFRSSYYLFLDLNDDIGMGDQLHNIGNVYNYSHKPQDAIEYMEKALTQYKYVNYKYGIGNTLGDLGLLYLQVRNSEKGIELLEQSYSTFKEIGDFLGMGNQLNNTAMYYNNFENDFEKAMQYYDRAMEMFEQLGDMQGISLVKNNMGMLYADQENYPKTLTIFEEVLEIDKKRGDPFNIGVDLRQIAKVHKHLGDQEKFSEYLEQAYNLLQKSNPDHEVTKIVFDELESLKSSRT